VVVSKPGLSAFVLSFAAQKASPTGRTQPGRAASAFGGRLGSQGPAKPRHGAAEQRMSARPSDRGQKTKDERPVDPANAQASKPHRASIASLDVACTQQSKKY